MKKHLIPIMNTVLILLVVGAIAFVVYNGVFKQREALMNPTDSISETADATVRARVSSEEFRIGVVQHVDTPTAQKCYEGFIDRLKALGVFENIEFDYIFEANDEKCIKAIEKLSTSDCDLVFTIGQFASENACRLIKDIPVVFADVTEPEKLESVESNEVPGGNVTGVSTYTPCFEQIDLIPLLLPQAKKVGSLYCKTDAAAMTQAIIAEKEATETLKLSFERYPVLSSDEIGDALEDIKDDEIEVLYLPSDEMIFGNLDTVIKFTDENKIPVICADEQTLKAGGFATSIINYQSVGEESAGLAYSILFDKKQPGTLPINYNCNCFSYVNQNVMKNLGITLSGDALNVVELRKYTVD